MAFLKRRFGAHLSEAARETLASRRPYPPIAAIRNPLTRQLLRRLAESDWESTLTQLDFDYSMTDETIAGVPCVRYRTSNTRSETPLIVYLHAGGFVSGSASVNAAAVLPTCHLSGCEAIAVNYALAPEEVYPRQLDEIEAVYREILNTGRDPSSIVLLGDSAGGALAASTIFRLRRTGLALPGALVLLSAPLDAEAASDTVESVRGRDPLFAAAGRNTLQECFRVYAGGSDVRDPEVSPMMGDLTGFPPMLVHAGTREALLGDSARFAEKARRAGVDVSLRVFDGMFHLFHQHWRLSEAKEAHQDIASFIARATR